HLFLTNFDTQVASLEELRDNVTFAVNVTAIRMRQRELESEEGNIWNDVDLPTMKLLPDLIHDAVMLFYLAVKNISVMYEINPPAIPYTYEDGNENPWPMGLYINRVMKFIASADDSHFHMSYMQFDDGGQRINFTLEIYEPVDNYLATADGHISQKVVELTNIKKIVYKVATRIGEPYFMLNRLRFTDAHMGICDLTITQKRKTVVDFTVPFMQLGISILAYEKPIEQKSWNAFLEPFTNEVWIYVMFSIFIMAFLFLFMARISKGEWQNPHPCNKNPEVLENTWNVSNVFWLTIGSIMTAGSDILPRSAPMRTFNAMWWIFAVIIANSYTANLAAFLTNSKMEGDIKGVEDLAKQNEVKFGTIEGGSTYTFFSESNETAFRLAYNMMQSQDPSVYTKSNNEGVERVLKNNGSYMFLMETTSLEYNTERNCKLKMLGETFGEKHYAIAVPFGAEYRSNLSVAILKLGELGKLFELKKKWWVNENKSCPQKTKANSETNDLNFTEVRGIFYTLYVGLFIAYVVGITEFLIYAQHVAVEEKLTFKEALTKELKFVLKVWNNKKPVTPACSTASSSHRSGSTDKSSKPYAIRSDRVNGTNDMDERKSALFYDNEFEIEEAFVQSIEFVNTLSKDEFLLQPIVMRLNTYDSTMFIEKYDVVAVLANITGIPNILFDTIIEEPEEQKAGHQLTVNVYPAQQMISKAYSDIIHNYGWRKFNLVYDIDDDTAPMRLQDIIQLRDLYIDAVRLRKYRKGDDYRNLWKSMKGDRRVILDCPADILVEMLNASIPFDMTGQFNHLFLTNLEDLEGILEPLRNNETFALNITAVRFKEMPTNLPNLNQVNNEPSQKLLPKLIHDAVMLYYLALKNITTHYIIEDPPQYTCENLDFSGEMGRWPFGEYIRRIMGQ
ncbi:glutamate receptor ionotropic, kainate 2-like, partial [Musca vetustissima]|uniref:glutamate receptor ionotropic, kainate 2-like n=1 Tax=Musca vetustissima TaxID=27455 RepID=UPI002AB7E24A